MSKHLTRDLESLEHDLLAQSSVVEKMIYRASQALKERNSDLIELLMNDEESVNTREVEIEEACLKILALHQPVAIDLRFVTTVLKLNGDLERIADLAVNIGERAQSIIPYAGFQIPAILDQMVDMSIGMVRDALDAFVHLDIENARDVCLKDDEVDEMNRNCIREIHDYVRDNPNDVYPALQIFSASRHIERIADHATNIAEDVIYLVDGEIARHRDGTPFQ